jgi:ABC-type bacteriocin/lantibiotic exporter with double-glycine peptidase domain
MIKIDNLNVSFNDEKIYNNFSLNIKHGEKITIVGESGSGKSTLLNILSGFISEFTGKIVIKDMLLSPININKIRALTAWLPQNTFIQFQTVNEMFFLPFRFNLNKNNTPSKNEIDTIFDIFELPVSILKKHSKDISGGQRQRILLASCLLLKKPILLLDEPTSALSNNVKHKITDYILSNKDTTIISASHDNYWIDKSDRIIEL